MFKATITSSRIIQFCVDYETLVKSKFSKRLNTCLTTTQ